MNINDFAEWLDVIYKVMMGVFGIWLYLDRRNDKTHVRISNLEDRIDDRLDTHAMQLTKLETELNKQPTHDHLADVYREIRKVSDSVSAMSSSLSAVHATLESVKDLTSRMDTFWRNNK